jgi:hypothetical protein
MLNNVLIEFIMMVSYTEANEMNLEGMNAKTILALFMIVAAIGFQDLNMQNLQVILG